MLKPSFHNNMIEAGCDEAGRGCLAGPVFAAAVILSKDFSIPTLNDSKQLSIRQRLEMRVIIEQESIAFAVEKAEAYEIDRINILNASILAMHRAISKLRVKPEFLLIDGNRFREYPNIPHKCIVKGDSLYMNIAAASVLAKTYRDEYMENLSLEYPSYLWGKNKGYPTLEHRKAIEQYGITPFHRRSFKLTEKQLEIPF